jgi:hypothetical protein
MARRTQSTKRPQPLTATLAVVLAVALLIPAAALAEPAATDEYSLGEVGTGAVAGRSDTLRVDEGSARDAEPSPGVIGEQTAAESPLAATGAVASVGIWALVAVIALGGSAILLRTTRRAA